MAEDEIIAARRRAQTSWFADGIAELVGGAVLAVLGAFLFASTRSGSGVFSALALVVLVGGVPLSAAAVRRVKLKITHGRVEAADSEPHRGRGRGIRLIGAMIAAASLVVFAVSSGTYTFRGILGTVMLAVLGLGVSISMALRAHRLGLPRFYINAGVVALSSAVCVVLGLSFIAGVGVVWMAHGVTSVLTGATVFAEYMTRTPSPEPDVS